MEVDEAPVASTIYHERQVGNLCALHAINTVLQDRVFIEEDLIAIAENLDNIEQSLTPSTVQCKIQPQLLHRAKFRILTLKTLFLYLPVIITGKEYSS